MKIIYTLIFLSFFGLCANAQWQHTSGPAGYGGSNVYSLLAHGTDLFAGTQEEIWLTHDSGSTWILDTAGFSVPHNWYFGISEFCVMGNTLIALVSAHKIYRSEINVNYWSQVGEINYFYHGGYFAVIGSNLFAGGYGGTGLLVSADTGRNWTPVVSTGLTTNWIDDLAVSGTDLYAATIEGVFVSVNNGVTWNRAGLDGLIVTNLIARGDTLYARAQGKGLCLSTNNGLTWDVIYPDPYINTDITILVEGKNIFIGTQFTGVLLSTNYGVSWTNVSGGLADSTINALAIVGNNLFAGSLFSGVYKASINDLIQFSMNLEMQQIMVYPNPFTEKLNCAIKDKEPSEIILYDIASRKTLQQEFTTAVSLNTGRLAKGIYLYELRNKNGVIKKGKVIKDRE